MEESTHVAAGPNDQEINHNPTEIIADQEMPEVTTPFDPNTMEVYLLEQDDNQYTVIAVDESTDTHQEFSYADFIDQYGKYTRVRELLATQRAEIERERGIYTHQFNLERLRVEFADQVIFRDGEAVFRLDYDKINQFLQERPSLKEVVMRQYQIDQSARYRQRLEDYPDRKYHYADGIIEASRSIFLGKDHGLHNIDENERETFTARINEVLANLTHEQKMDFAIKDRFFQLLVMPLGQMDIISFGSIKSLLTLDPRELVRMYGDCEFFKLIFDGQEQRFTDAFAAYGKFENQYGEMKASTEKQLDDIIAYYGFKKMSQYQEEGLDAWQLLEKMREIATVLCRHVHENFHYDNVYLGERDVVPYKYQEDYETYLAVVQGRGICTSAAYALESLLSRLEIPYLRLAGRSKNGIHHAFLGVAGHIYDPTGGLVGMGTFDYAQEHCSVILDRSNGNVMLDIEEYQAHADYSDTFDIDEDLNIRSLPMATIDSYLASHPIWQIDRTPPPSATTEVSLDDFR